MNLKLHDLSIESLDYVTLFQGDTIDLEEYLKLHETATEIASVFYADHYDVYCSLFDNVRLSGVKAITEMNDRFHELYRARALYLPDEQTIYLYEKDINELAVLTAEYGISKADIRSMMIAHELFHHLENLTDRQVDQLLIEKFGRAAYHRGYRETAAHHFAYLVTGNHPEYLDYLSLKNKDPERLSKYLDHFDKLYGREK